VGRWRLAKRLGLCGLDCAVQLRGDRAPSAHDLPDNLLSGGANTFTLAEATQLLERSGDAVRKGLKRLARKRLIFSPARGFYVVVPPQFRPQGTVPATHFIDAMMQALGRRY
jgi:hypothetical protein